MSEDMPFVLDQLRLIVLCSALPFLLHWMASSFGSDSNSDSDTDTDTDSSDSSSSSGCDLPDLPPMPINISIENVREAFQVLKWFVDKNVKITPEVLDEIQDILISDDSNKTTRFLSMAYELKTENKNEWNFNFESQKETTTSRGRKRVNSEPLTHSIKTDQVSFSPLDNSNQTNSQALEEPKQTVKPKFERGDIIRLNVPSTSFKQKRKRFMRNALFFKHNRQRK